MVKKNVTVLMFLLCFRYFSKMRYFVNRYQDISPGTKVEIDRDSITEQVMLLTTEVQRKMPPTSHNCDGGVYVGCAGVAYAFHYIATKPYFSPMRAILLSRAKEYADIAVQYADRRQSRDPPAAFLLGKAGSYAVASLAYADLGDLQAATDLMNRYIQLAPMLLPPDRVKTGSDELFVGRAGYLCGLLALRRQFGDAVFSQSNALNICKAIIESGKQYALKHRSPCPLMYAYYDTEYLGAAHGLSSILQMLLSVPNFLALDPAAEHAVRQCVDYLLSIMTSDGNTPTALDEIEFHQRPASEELVHWCHGAPGVVYLMARAYLVWQDTKYLNACKKCADLTWEKGLLRKGPSICHGVAGSGYVFLLLYRLTNNSLYLHRAVAFANFLNTEEFKEARQPDSPYSLYEGWAGTACFLADLLHPEQAEFPFFNVHY